MFYLLSSTRKHTWREKIWKENIVKRKSNLQLYVNIEKEKWGELLKKTNKDIQSIQ